MKGSLFITVAGKPTQTGSVFFKLADPGLTSPKTQVLLHMYLTSILSICNKNPKSHFLLCSSLSSSPDNTCNLGMFYSPYLVAW